MQFESALPKALATPGYLPLRLVRLSEQTLTQGLEVRHIDGVPARVSELIERENAAYPLACVSCT